MCRVPPILPLNKPSLPECIVDKGAESRGQSLHGIQENWNPGISYFKMFNVGVVLTEEVKNKSIE